MMILIDKNEPDIFPAEIFDTAVTNVMQFISLAETRIAFAKSIDDFSDADYTCATNGAFTVRLIQRTTEMADCCCAYPADDPEGLYFNPVLLVNMIRDLKNFPTACSKFADHPIHLYSGVLV
jgi:hypothetical protein